jgi:oxygen-independent coproporphyrinogen III oxidase
MQAIPFDRALQLKYDVPGPRYTSYPTAPHFSAEFDADAYAAVAAESNAEPMPRPLSLYVHIPFCESLCFYCACNKIVTRHREKADVYLNHLEKELAMQGRLFDRDRPVRQLHLGGGTPTYLSNQQLWRLMQSVHRHFALAECREREFSVEVDPREVDADTLAVLGDLGFNRLSLGVQDFDSRVQKAVNREQSIALVADVVGRARRAGFASISFDLIYGLPFQSVATFRKTLDAVIAMRPDRLSVYNYAHLPERVKAQRLIRQEDLPTPSEKLSILASTVERLTDAGYVTIGMDHFALPDSDMAKAMAGGSLQRNFQGYSTHSECDLIGVGVTSIGKVGDSYIQNVKHLRSYYALLDQGRLPVERGCLLDADDVLRRAVIEAVMCRVRVDYTEFEERFNIDFQRYFRGELRELDQLEGDGLVTREAAGLRIHPRGRMLLRNVAMVFDRYLREQRIQVRYSQTV